AVGDFGAVGVDGRVQCRARLRDRAGRFGDDRRRRDRGQRFEAGIQAFARPAGVGGRDTEVVGGVGAQAADRGGDRHGGGAFAHRLGTAGGRAVAFGGPVFEFAVGDF